MEGVKAFWHWMRAHPATAAVLFLLVVPLLLYGLLGTVRGFALKLPGASKVASIGDKLGGAGQAGG